MFAFQSTPKKLLDQTKETIFIIALEKIHIIGENRKWVIWEAKDIFCIFGIIIPKGLYKNYTTGLQLGFPHSARTLCLTFKKLRRYAKRPLLKIVSMSLICPIMP